MRIAAVLLTTLILAVASRADELVVNGRFEGPVGQSGLPAGWVPIASDGGSERFETVDLPDGGRAVRVACLDRGRRWGPGVGQLGISVTGRQWYRLTFLGRQDGLDNGFVWVALRDTSDWTANLLWVPQELDTEWSEVSVEFRADRDLDGAVSRLQVGFDGGGQIWIRDVSLTPIPPPPPKPPSHLVSTAGRPNRLPNGGFEVGACGWGTWGWDELVASIDDTTAAEGAQSMRIDFGPESFPRLVNDWTYTSGARATTTALRSLPLANIGFLPVEPGEPHTFSVSLRSRPAGLAVVLRVLSPSGGRTEEKVTAGEEWDRASLRFVPTEVAVCVQIDPQLPAGAEAASLWVDAVRVAPGDETDYTPAFPIECGVATGHEGNWYTLGEPLTAAATLYNGGPEATVRLRWWFEDFFGARVAEGEVPITVGSGQRHEASIATGPTEAGFYRLHTALSGDGWEQTRSDRLAVLFPQPDGPAGDDALLGINHPFVSDLLMRVSRRIGIGWARLWACKWDDVEPEQGRWTFDESDAQLARLERLGFRSLLCLASPSSGWASTAPAELTGRTPSEAEPQRNWWLPRSWDLYDGYVSAVVRRYRDRVDHWEVFNEPTDRKGGPESNLDLAHNYLRFLTAVKQIVARDDPGGAVLGAGLGYLANQADLGAVLLEMDILSEHRYPRLAQPLGFQNDLDRAVATLQEHGSGATIWITEYGVYADDDPDPTTTGSAFMVGGRNAERRAAIRVVQHHVAARAAGVEKIFHHIGNWPLNVNFEHGCGFHPFFEYGGVPRKTGQVLNVFATLLGGGTRFVDRLSTHPALAAYEFSAADEQRFVLWSGARQTVPAELTAALGAEGAVVRSITGARMEPPAELTDCPIYVLAPPAQAAALRTAIRAWGETLSAR